MSGDTVLSYPVFEDDKTRPGSGAYHDFRDSFSGLRNDIQNVSEIIVHYKVREMGNNTIITGSASLSGDVLIKKPSEFTLLQNIHNPFNPTTTIDYKIPFETHVRLVIYNVSGQQVAVLKDEVEASGKYSVIWNAKGMPSGIYFYRLRTGEFNETKKMLLLK